MAERAAGWTRGQLPRINRVLLVDALGAVFGGVAAASSATTYIESAAGVAVGGRTGLTSALMLLWSMMPGGAGKSLAGTVVFWCTLRAVSRVSR